MKTIEAFEVIDHGVEHCQYFQGCGVALTDFEHVVTGCGNDAHEALEDAIEMLAQDDWDTTSLGEEEEDLSDDVVPEDADETYYYVSIRVK